MNFLDLDSFRSRYSDITVTALPPKRQKLDTDQLPQECENVVERTAQRAEVPPHVEIMPMCPSSSSSSAAPPGYSQQQQQHNRLQHQQLEAAAYANEYKQVLAKLEYTKYVQAQLQLISMSNEQLCPNNFESNDSFNIVEAYTNLLGVIAEMQIKLGPTAIGLRAPKERLLRDIAHARVLVRECILSLMRDHEQEQ